MQVWMYTHTHTHTHTSIHPSIHPYQIKNLSNNALRVPTSLVQHGQLLPRPRGLSSLFLLLLQPRTPAPPAPAPGPSHRGHVPCNAWLDHACQHAIDAIEGLDHAIDRQAHAQLARRLRHCCACRPRPKARLGLGGVIPLSSCLIPAPRIAGQRSREVEDTHGLRDARRRRQKRAV